MAGTVDEDLLRRLAPQVLGALVRRYGHFDTAEDAVQEALLAAATQWPSAGVPDRPLAWLITVASRRLTDLLRSEQSRRRREEAWVLPGAARRAGRRLVGAAVPVCPPIAATGGADRADTPRGGRVDHGGDRARVFGPGADDRAADQSRQEDDSRERGAVSVTRGCRASGTSRRRAARDLPDLHRGIREHIRADAAPPGTRAGGDPVGPDGACTAARGPGGRGVAGVAAAHRRAAGGADRTGRVPGADGGTGSLALGRRTDRRRASR